MRESFEDLKCFLQSYDKKNSLKIAVIAVIIALAIIGIILAIVYIVHGCRCGCFERDFCDCDDEFDDDDDEDDFEE